MPIVEPNPLATLGMKKKRGKTAGASKIPEESEVVFE
jgi:hypothetical protein